MNQVEIVMATPDHVRELGENMRSADAMEAQKLGFVPHRLLWRTYKRSLFARAGLIHGQVYAMWGVCGNALGEIGQPWFVTREGVATMLSPVDFAMIYRREVNKMQKMFPVLENWVDSSYTEAVRLMRIVGFNVDNPMPHGKHQVLFSRFWMKS